MTKKILLLVVFIIIHVRADFVHVSKWDRQLPDGAQQSILFFGDVHNQERIGFKQAQDVVQFLAQRNNAHDALLIEDMNDASGLARRIDSFFNVYPHEQDRQRLKESLARVAAIYEDERNLQVQQQVNATLFVLPYFARQQNIACSNIDFRQFLSCDAPRLAITKYENGHIIMPTILEQLFHEIAAYDDTPELNAYYAQVLERFKPFMQMITKIMQEHNLIFQDLPDYFARAFMRDPLAYALKQFKSASLLSFNRYHEKLGKALAFLRPTSSDETYQKLHAILVDLLDLTSVELVDAVIMHELYQQQIAQEHENILCVCVGQAHMVSVEKHLKQFGYEKVDQCFNAGGVDVERFCAAHQQVNAVAEAEEQHDSPSLLSSFAAWLHYLFKCLYPF